MANPMEQVTQSEKAVIKTLDTVAEALDQVGTDSLDKAVSRVHQAALEAKERLQAAMELCQVDMLDVAGLINCKMVTVTSEIANSYIRNGRLLENHEKLREESSPVVSPEPRTEVEKPKSKKEKGSNGKAD